MSSRYYIAFFFICALFVPQSLAHLAAGSDVEVNGYIVDFGYSPEVLSDEESIILNFNIVNATTLAAVDDMPLWVRIEDDEDVVFASEIALTQGNANLVLAFFEEGTYKISLREPFAHTFEITVHESYETKEIVCALLVGALILFVGVIIGYFVQKKCAKATKQKTIRTK